MVVGLALMAYPSVGLVAFGIATDWIDGAIARRGAAARYGARFDLEADSLLTLGAAIAAMRRGRGTFLLLAPVARYAVEAVRDPSTYSPSEFFWDRVTGIAQMGLLVAALSPSSLPAHWGLAGPVTAARFAVLAAVLTNRGAVHSISSQATGGGPLWSVPRGRRP